ncbi:MAG: hypothetical protein WAW78_12345, partial [Propioniciclava sp.]
PFRIHAVTALNSSILRQGGSLYGVRSEEFYHWIRSMHSSLVAELAAVGVNYDDIARALVPHPGRREIALLFDWGVASRASGGFYGHHLAEVWIPALPRPARNSGLNAILHGDLLDGRGSTLRAALLERGELVNPNYLNADQIYVVYVSNLSRAQAETLIADVRTDPAYVGHADCTTHSALKEHIALSLPQLGLRVGSVVLDGVYDDVPNPLGYPFEAAGFTTVGVTSELYLPFLTFRINTRLTGRNFSDSELAFGALDPNAGAVESPNVWMTASRFEYLHSGQHRGALALAELVHLEREALEMTLTGLSAEGHMYNLRYERHANTGDEVLMYNSLVEIDTTTGTRLHTLALKYDPETRASELVTFI